MTRKELLNSPEYWQEIAETLCYNEGIDYTLQLVDKKRMIDKACGQLCKVCYVGERNKLKQCGPCQCEGGDFYNFRKSMEE